MIGKYELESLIHRRDELLRIRENQDGLTIWQARELDEIIAKIGEPPDTIHQGIDLKFLCGKN